MATATSSDFTVRTSGIGYYPNPVEATRKEQLAYMEIHNESTGETRWFYLKPTGEFAVYRGVETSGRIVSLLTDKDEPLDIAVDLNLFHGEICHFKDFSAESLAKRQLEVLTFFDEVEKAHAAHKTEERKVPHLDEETIRQLEEMDAASSPNSPTHVRRDSDPLKVASEFTVTGESMLGAPVLVRTVSTHEKGSGTADHLQVSQPTKRDRDPVERMPDSPRPAQTSTFAKWFANCQCSRRTKIVGLTAIAALGASIAAYVAIQKGYATVPNMPEIKMPDLSSWRQYMPWQENEMTDEAPGSSGHGTPQDPPKAEL